jgi:hypothetical protein
MFEENSSAMTKEINDIIFHSGNQIPWYKRLPGEKRRDSVAPLRLFTSVSFSNLLPSFLCLFPSLCRGPRAQPRTYKSSSVLRMGEAVGPMTFFFSFSFSEKLTSI